MYHVKQIREAKLETQEDGRNKFHPKALESAAVQRGHEKMCERSKRCHVSSPARNSLKSPLPKKSASRSPSGDNQNRS